MPGVAARLRPATQSKLLTRHFLVEHACALALVSTCRSELTSPGEFGWLFAVCRRYEAPSFAAATCRLYLRACLLWPFIRAAVSALIDSAPLFTARSRLRRRLLAREDSVVIGLEDWGGRNVRV